MTAAQTTPRDLNAPLVAQTFCSDGRTITYNVGVGWPLMVTAMAANGLIADNARLRAALANALYELEATNAVKPYGHRGYVAMEQARAALAQSPQSADTTKGE